MILTSGKAREDCVARPVIGMVMRVHPISHGPGASGAGVYFPTTKIEKESGSIGQTVAIDSDRLPVDAGSWGLDFRILEGSAGYQALFVLCLANLNHLSRFLYARIPPSSRAPEIQLLRW